MTIVAQVVGKRSGWGYGKGGVWLGGSRIFRLSRGSPLTHSGAWRLIPFAMVLRPQLVPLAEIRQQRVVVGVSQRDFKAGMINGITRVVTLLRRRQHGR